MKLTKIFKSIRKNNYNLELIKIYKNQINMNLLHHQIVIMMIKAALKSRYKQIIKNKIVMMNIKIHIIMVVKINFK